MGKVSACDVFVGIYKNRYGFIPEGNNPGELSVTELEYNKAKELKKPIIIFEFFDESSREKKLTKFLVRVKNFTNGNFINHYKNLDDLRYNLLCSMVFGILGLDGIEQSVKNELKELIKEDIRYRDYLLNKYQYVNTRGFPPLNRIVNLEIEKFFITQKLTPLITNELELQFDESDTDLDQSYEKK